MLTVTIESADEGDAIHFHAGGQGVWVARLAQALGADVTLCAPIGGEAGSVVRRLLLDEQLRLCTVVASAQTAAYVHDRRSGRREQVAQQSPSHLDRHELDDLTDRMLESAIDAGTAVVTGSADGSVLPPWSFEHLVRDLRVVDVRTIIDLSGDQLDAAVSGGPDLVKVSDEELLRDHRIEQATTDEIVSAAARLIGAGARAVVVSCEDRPVLAVSGDQVLAAHPPGFAVVDPRGAGDSMTAALAVSLARGEPLDAGLRLAVAAGSINVTRHGLATGPRTAIETLARKVAVHRLGSEPNRR